ncbi:MAG: hypothetical protein Q8M83_04365 [bacterium]|nr:hypothetical protein [bacterium]
MAVSKNTPTKPRKEMKRELIVLDFTEHGVIEMLSDLLAMANEGQINGLVFAARLESGQGEPYLFGSSGRLAYNQAEAVGAAVLLQNKLAGM